MAVDLVLEHTVRYEPGTAVTYSIMSVNGYFVLNILMKMAV